jgi:hypothetical protein
MTKPHVLKEIVRTLMTHAACLQPHGSQQMYRPQIDTRHRDFSFAGGGYFPLLFAMGSMLIQADSCTLHHHTVCVILRKEY